MVNTKAAIKQLLADVPDPEVPVLSVLDLGVVRDIKVSEDAVTIVITPTYSGCPAMDMISMGIRIRLAEAGYKNVVIESQLSPAWTTDWMSESGKKKLKEYGIAPPQNNNAGSEDLFAPAVNVPCPLCDSHNTEMISGFGSTSCKALYRCLDCKEPFDYFKCHR